MKTLFLSFVAVLCLSFIFSSCSTNHEKISDNEIPQEIMDALSAKGFSLEGLTYTAAEEDSPEGYIVEGDILMTRDDILGKAEEMSVPGMDLEEEQYRTRNLVRVTSGTRTIRVRPANNLNTKTKQALNRAISRFNDLGLRIRFLRVINNPHISIGYNSNLPAYGGRAGFPYSNGNPYYKVDLHPSTTNLNSHTLSRLIMHELGHCIGMRHTDFYDRRSCNQNTNEGQGSVGAIHIPGTTIGRDNASVFKACYSFGDNSKFSNNDKRALSYIY